MTIQPVRKMASGSSNTRGGLFSRIVWVIGSFALVFNFNSISFKSLGELTLNRQVETKLTSETVQQRPSALDGTQLGISTSKKWRLWHEMSVEQQNQSLKEASVYVTKYGKGVGLTDRQVLYPGSADADCQGKSFGTRSNEHMLCNTPPPKPCFFVSCGINDDFSFDTALADEWGCRGIGLDPTVDHNSHLHPNVTFHNIGMNIIGDNEQKATNMGGAEWWYSSIPNIAKFFQVPYIDVLKIDCEGCEFAFTRDILAEDPAFLERVGQITFETHVSLEWVKTEEHLYYFSIMFPLLEEAGFKIVESTRNACSGRHEIGCRDEFQEWGFPCGGGKRPHKDDGTLTENLEIVS